MNRVYTPNDIPILMDDWQNQKTASSTNTTINININVTMNGTDSTSKNRGGLMKTFVVLSPGEDGYVLAECPSLPGCMSQGKTKEEAMENIKEAIELCREAAQEQGLTELEVVEVEV